MKITILIINLVIFFAFFGDGSCQESEEVRRRRQNGVFFGLTGLDRTVPFDLDAFFEHAAPSKTSPKVVDVSRPQRASTSTSTTTTTELPPLRKPVVSSDGVRLRLFNADPEERQFETQSSSFQQETPSFVQRTRQEPREFRRRPPSFATSEDHRIEDNFRERAPVTQRENSRESFSPIQDQSRESFQPIPRQEQRDQEHRPVATFDFSGLDPVRQNVPSQEDRFRSRSQQPQSFRQSFVPSSVETESHSEVPSGRQFRVPARVSAEAPRSQFAEIERRQQQQQRFTNAPQQAAETERQQQRFTNVPREESEIERRQQQQRFQSVPQQESETERRQQQQQRFQSVPQQESETERRHQQRFPSASQQESEPESDTRQLQQPANEHFLINEQEEAPQREFSGEGFTRSQEENASQQPEFETPRSSERPTHFDFNPSFDGGSHAQDDGASPTGTSDGEEVFDEEAKAESPQTDNAPTQSTELRFDDQFQSTERDIGADQFQDDGQFQDNTHFQNNNEEQLPVREEVRTQHEPQEQHRQFQPPEERSRDVSGPKVEHKDSSTTSPDEHSNFPESIAQAPRVARPIPQRFSVLSPPAPVASPPSVNVPSARHFPSTIPVGDLHRDRSLESRQPNTFRRPEFDARSIRKPFQEVSSFRDSQSFDAPPETHFRTFNNRPRPAAVEPLPSRPTRPSVRLETTGQISPSFVRVTEPTDFSVPSVETEISSEDEFTSNRLGISTRRPTTSKPIRRTTTSKPLRRKSFTRRPTPTVAATFYSPSSASVAKPSESTTTAFRSPARGGNSDRRTSNSNFIRNNRIFNNGASATENTIDDSFSPGFTPQAVSRGDSRGGAPPPTYGQIATACDHQTCQLPNCFCGGNQIMPGNLRPEEIPQIVILTFDDAVNDLNWKLYTRLYFQNRKNPNGCPIKSTFYVSHEWTDYSKVQNLYAAGHEIASHSISHGDGRDYSKKKWYNEIYGQREILSVYANVDIDDIKGMRSPFLAMGGDKQFSMLYETNFTYESSMTVTDVHPPFWPYTLDYAIPHRCAIPPCPKQSYPGFWEIPMVALTDLNGGKCSMADSCSFATTEDGIYDMLIKNFERHYRSNRAPFGLYYHASWFLIPHRQEGFVKFLDEILKKDDVYLVTALQALEWIKNPTPLSDIKRFVPWGCNEPSKATTCDRPRSCELKFKGEIRYMSSCLSCPNVYPWVGDTGITKHKHTILSN